MRRWEQGPHREEEGASPPRLRRVVLRLVLLAHAPAYAALAGLLLLHQHDERVRSQEQLMSGCRALAASLSQRAGEVERHLRELARRVPADPQLLPEFRREVDQARERAAVDRIVLAGGDGDVLADTSLPTPTEGQGSLALMGAASGGDSARSGHSRQPAPGPELALAVPTGETGLGRLQLEARLDATRLRPLLAGLGLPPQWAPLVLDDRGNVVALRPAAARLGDSVTIGGLRSVMAGRPGGVVELPTADGARVVTAYLRSPEHGWTVLVGLPRAELNAPVWRSAGAPVLLLATLLLALPWFTLRRARGLLSSVDTLRRQAEALPQADTPAAEPLAFAEAAVVSERLHACGVAVRDAQGRLQASEERLRAVLDTAQDAVLLCDARHRIVLANAAAQRMFGASGEALAEQHLQQLLEPETWAACLAARAQASGSRGADEVPARGQGRRLDGTVFPIEYSLEQCTGADGARLCTIVARDIGARLQQEASLLATRTELQRMQQDFHLALVRESAARQLAIARELHDSVGSSLAGISLLLGTARAFTHEPEAAVLISHSQEQVTRATRRVREISRGLMPDSTERGDLLLALGQFAAEMNAIPGLGCTLSYRGDFEGVPAPAAEHLFRIVQEAATNALRHGGARHVRITLARADSRCRLTVLDDGRGFEPPADSSPPAGMGLASMRARAAAIGGSFHLGRRPGGGMRIRVAWTATDDATDAEAGL